MNTHEKRVVNERKPNRLKGYDYSSEETYFITICTHDRINYFWDNDNYDCDKDSVRLSKYGNIVDAALKNISKYYPSVILDNYVVMPNHVHLLLQIVSIHGDKKTSISTVIQQTKGYITKLIGFSVWQKLFHDHIVRNENEYKVIWQYIEVNPRIWKEDTFYNVES